MGTITVVTPATTDTLIALADIKEELQITGTDDDAWLTKLANQITGLIEDYCGRTLRQQTVKELVSARGGVYLYASITPIVSITAIIRDGVTVPAADYALANDEAGLIRHKQGAWQGTAAQTFGVLGEPRVGTEVPIYEVEYQGGYAADSVPHSLQRVALQLIKHFYHARERDPDVQSEAVPGVYQVTYREPDDGGDGADKHGLPMWAARYLAPWKRRRV